jgi:2-polyprenyl-6-methoxyphenol hydroxylase-like FAD-dependent oxidoreductase
MSCGLNDAIGIRQDRSPFTGGVILLWQTNRAIPNRRSKRNRTPQRWLANPATYCDFFVVDYWAPPRIVRIALGESAGNGHPPFFRVGIAMPLEDARELAETLLRARREKGKAPTKPAPPKT